MRAFAMLRMIALMARAAVAVVDGLLPIGYQTVSTHANIEHVVGVSVAAQDSGSIITQIHLK